MDTGIRESIERNQSKPLGRHVKMLIIVTLSVVLVLWYLLVGQKQSLPLEQMRITQVKQGTLTVEVKGYGKLRAKHQRVISSDNQGMVEQVHHYPGDNVSKDTVILTLSNPQLTQQIVAARLELIKHTAQLEEKRLDNKYTLVEREMELDNLRNQTQLAKLEYEAKKNLLKQGIISKLEFEQASAKVNELNNRVKSDQQKLTYLSQLQQQQLQLQQQILEQVQLSYDAAVAMQDNLEVKAGIDGILQQLHVEIGASVAPGEKLALIGSEKGMIVRLKVPQLNSDKIAIGMPGKINTLGGEVKTIVRRIDPTVVEGRVSVELDLVGDYPSNVRPDATVDGAIEIGAIENTLYIETPSNAQANTSQALIKVDKDDAQWQQVKFGNQTDQYIEVLSGASIGDSFVISDLSEYKGAGDFAIAGSNANL